MPELPHFSEGRYGKLTSDVLNVLVDAVNKLSDEVEQNQQGNVPTNAPAFPFMARLGAALYNSDGNLRGYEWEEVVHTNVGTVSPIGRKYEPPTPGQTDSPIAVPVVGLGTVIRSGQVGMMHAVNVVGGPEAGKAQLAFISDTRDQGVFVGRIVNSTPTPISGGAQFYEIKKVSFNGSGQPIDSEENQSFFGWNGAELLNGGEMGGSVVGVGECSPIVFPVTLPTDTFVVAVDVSLSDGSGSFCLFNQMNDVAIACNCAQGIPSTDEAQEGYSDPTARDRDDDKPYYGTSMEGAMQ
tara:strand:+ start:5747 stop:6634 length:888 start_codon:yes stop_codon:yes gene_type:complete